MSGIQITGLPDQPIEKRPPAEHPHRLLWRRHPRTRPPSTPRELGSGYPEPSNIGTMPSYGLFARHVRGLELADVSFDYLQEDFRPPVRCVDVDGLEIDHLKARHADGVPAKSFEKVTDVAIPQLARLRVMPARGSRSLPSSRRGNHAHQQSSSGWHAAEQGA